MSDVSGGFEQPEQQPGQQPGQLGEPPLPWASPSEAGSGSPTPDPTDSPAGGPPAGTLGGAVTGGARSGGTGAGTGGAGTGGKGSRGRIALIVVVLLVLLGGGGAAVVLLSGDDEPTAAELFAASKDWVSEAGTATVTGEGRVESGQLDQSSGEGSDGGTGSSIVQRMKISGQVAWPDRSLMRLDLGTEGGVVEALVIERDVYVRRAEKASDLDESSWEKIELPSGVVAPDGGGPILDPNDPSSGGPLDLGEILSVADAPKTFSRDGSKYVLVLDLDPGDVLPEPASEEEKVDTMTLTLRLDEDGRIFGYTLVEEGKSVHSEITLNFNWDAKVSIEPPSADQVDPTPQVNEEAVASFTAAPVLVPASIPAGWVLTLGDLAPAEETTEGCEEVMVTYENPDSPESGYLSLYVFNTDCEGLDLVPPPGADEFLPGEASEGFVVGSPDDGWLAQFVVGTTVIQAETDLNPDELAQVMDKLVVFDPQVQPGEIKGIGLATSVG